MRSGVARSGAGGGATASSKNVALLAGESSELLLTDAGTTDKPTIRKKARLTSGTAAAGFGMTDLWELEAAGGTPRSAMSLETSWSVATDATPSAKAVWALNKAGTLTPVLEMGPDYVTVPGGTAIATPGLRFASGPGGIYHNGTNIYLATDVGQYAFAATPDTFQVTALWGFECSGGMFRVDRGGDAIRTYDNANALRFAQVANTFGWFDKAGTPAGQQTVTGSKAGNAALASLIAAVAAFGFIVDSTS